MDSSRGVETHQQQPSRRANATRHLFIDSTLALRAFLLCPENETSHARLVDALKARAVRGCHKWFEVRRSARRRRYRGCYRQARRQRTKMTVSVRGKDARTSYGVLDPRLRTGSRALAREAGAGRTRTRFAFISPRSGHPRGGRPALQRARFDCVGPSVPACCITPVYTPRDGQ